MVKPPEIDGSFPYLPLGPAGPTVRRIVEIGRRTNIGQVTYFAPAPGYVISPMLCGTGGSTMPHMADENVCNVRELVRPVEWGDVVSPGSGSVVLPVGIVTLLLGDIQGSTGLWEANTDAMPAALAALNLSIDDAVGAHGGVRPVEQGEGDSFIAAFSRASDAIAAALTIQRASATSPLLLRMGVHTGEVQLRGEGNYMGPTVNRTARLRELGHGAQILLSRSTYELVADQLPDGVDVVDLGTHRLRDLGRPEQVFQLRHVDLPGNFPPLRSLDAVANNLPAQLTSFVGRHHELDELTDLLREHRLVTLTGSGGCGKTRLALQLAAAHTDQFPDGVWFCDLSPISDPAAVAEALAATLAVREMPGVAAATNIARRVGSSRLLVVLDNCEHVVAPAAELAETILQSCASVSLVATSREPLGVTGETVWRVPSLRIPAVENGPPRVEALSTFEAVQLFIDRARSARSNFSVTAANAAAVAAVCARLDGIALAIELAAARVRVLTVEQIEAGLGDRFRLLGGGSRTAMPRQQTLLASVGWSHDLLSDEQKLLFQRLSVFAGDFDLDAAEAVGGDHALPAALVLDLLAQLVDRSLVLMEDTEGVARYRMLETIRQYASDRLVDSGDAAIVRTRHLDHYQQRMTHVMSGLDTGDGYGTLLTQAQRENDNVMAALEWAITDRHVETGMRLASSLWAYWTLLCHFSEGRRIVEALDAAVVEPVDSAVHGGALFALANISEAVGDHAREMELAGRALDLARAAGDRKLEGRCLARIGWVEALTEVDVEAVQLRRAADIAREEHDTISLTQTLFALGQFIQGTRSFREARLIFDEALAVATMAGNTVGRLYPKVRLGWTDVMLGDVEAGVAALEASRAQFPQLGDLHWSASSGLLLGQARTLQGEPALAAELLRDAAETAQRFGHIPLHRWARSCLALVLVQLGEIDAAAAIIDEVLAGSAWTGLTEFSILAPALVASVAVRLHQGDLAAAQAVSDRLLAARPNRDAPGGTGLALLAAAAVARGVGDRVRAEQLAQESLASLAGTGATAYTPEVLDLLAMLDADQCDGTAAARLLGASEAQRRRMGTVRLGLFVSNDGVEDARESTGAAVWDPAFADGAELSLDETIEWVTRGRASRKRPATGWPSLTPTEIAVVKLVTEGLSNPEIAERMFIARRTVTTHLSHIFDKLGVTSRTELATAALRHGIE